MESIHVQEIKTNERERLETLTTLLLPSLPKIAPWPIPRLLSRPHYISFAQALPKSVFRGGLMVKCAVTRAC